MTPWSAAALSTLLRCPPRPDYQSPWTVPLLEVVHPQTITVHSILLYMLELDSVRAAVHVIRASTLRPSRQPSKLLVEKGFEGTHRAGRRQAVGVHSSALYRRWPSRIELIEEAIFPGFYPPIVAPTGDLRTDLLRFLQAYSAAFGHRRLGRLRRDSWPITRRPGRVARPRSTSRFRLDRNSRPSCGRTVRKRLPDDRPRRLL